MAEPLHGIGREIGEFHIVEHQRKVVVLKAMKITLPNHVESACLVQLGLQLYGVIGVKVKVLGSEADVGNVVFENIGQGVVFIRKAHVGQLKVLHIDFQCFPFLNMFNLSSNRVDDLLKNGGIFMLLTASEEGKVGSAVGIDNIGRAQA